MQRDTMIQLIATAVLLLGVGASLALTPLIGAEAGRAQLSYTTQAEEGDPPEVAVGVALGSFKGLFVNMLWLRAQALKDEGKFYDAIEVARTITKLTPRFPRVWSFHAWNLAYNISVATQTPEERWQWVQSGVRLLRDEGIPKNPNSILLYRELAWIFVHKIQGYSDDAHQYYKRKLAEEWTYVLGTPPPRARADDNDVQELLQGHLDDGVQRDLALERARRDANKSRRMAILNEVAQAPRTLEAFYEQNPQGRELVRRIREEAGLDLDKTLLRYFETLRAYVEAASSMGGELSIRLDEGQRNRDLEKLLYAGEYEETWRALIPFVRQRVIEDEYNMELPRMIRYTRVFGPLDWRHAGAHAVYWAATGVERAKQRRHIESFDFTNTDRLIMHAVQELFRWGDVQYDLLTGSYLAMYNLDYTEVYGQTIALLEERATMFEDENRHYRLYGKGYANHLRDVVRLYYRMGERALAEHYYERFRTWEGHNVNAPDSLVGEASLPLSEFVKQDLESRIDSPQVVTQEMYGALFDAYIRGLLRRQPDVYNAQLAYASQVHRYYMAEQNVKTPAGGDSRMAALIPDRFVDAAAEALVRVIAQGMIGSIQSAQLWNRAPLGLRQAAYDQLRRVMGDQMGGRFDTVFPEPPNMEQYRQARQQLQSGDAALRFLNLNVEQQ